MSGDVRTVVLTLGAVLLLVLGGVLVGLGRQRRCSGIAIALTLGAFILVDRPRPPNALIEIASASFPSSHMASATLGYGFLAVVLLQRVGRRGPQVLIVLTAVALVTLVGVSRLALGVYSLSDVLAAGAVSLAWLALCHAAVDRWRRARQGSP